MARDSKGTRVKSFTAHPAGLDLEKVKTVVPIYFHAADSDFSATLPPHIVEGIGRHPERPDKLRGNQVRSPMADDIEPLYEQCCKLYEKIQQNAMRKKVIWVHVRANHPTKGFPEMFSFQDISFAQVPALTMQYRVLWQVGDGLYSSNDMGEGRLDHLSFMSRVPEPSNKPYQTRDTFVVDWTEEREAFFESMKEGLIELIRRIAHLLAGDSGAKIDLLLASGNAGLLPPPDGSGT